MYALDHGADYTQAGELGQQQVYGMQLPPQQLVLSPQSV